MRHAGRVNLAGQKHDYVFTHCLRFVQHGFEPVRFEVLCCDRWRGSVPPVASETCTAAGLGNAGRRVSALQTVHGVNRCTILAGREDQIQFIARAKIKLHAHILAQPGALISLTFVKFLTRATTRKMAPIRTYSAAREPEPSIIAGGRSMKNVVPWPSLLS